MLASKIAWIGMKLWLLCFVAFWSFLRCLIYTQKNTQPKVKFIGSLENKELHDTASTMEAFCAAWGSCVGMRRILCLSGLYSAGCSAVTVVKFLIIYEQGTLYFILHWAYKLCFWSCSYLVTPPPPK